MIRYILSHPIQYQVPLIRFLNKKIKIKVSYRFDTANKKYFDKEFNKKIILDKNLLSGYQYNFLRYIGPNKLTGIFPITIEFINKNFSKETKIIWIHGIKNWYNFILIILSFFYKKKVFVRDEFNNIRKRNFLNKLINKIFYTFVDKFIDCYLSIGTENKKAFMAVGVNKKKIFNVPYVVNNNSFYIKNKKKNEKLKILFTGKLIHRKGCDILLKAVNLLNKKINFKKNCEIIIIGDGILKKELINLKKIYNLTNVIFKGFKNQNQIKKFYKQSDLFIMPSRNENWGLALNEAMAAKNAVIASDQIGSARDLLKNNFNGYMFKNNDYKDLAKKINKIYSNKRVVNKFGKNSYKIISQWSFNECFKGLSKAIKSMSNI
jgi:glycosyltransferase involved in cell wall biosynthesis